MPDEPPGQADGPSPEIGPPAAPQGEPRLVERFMAEFRGGFAGESVLDKLNSAQINKLIDQTNEESRRHHELDVQRYRMVFTLLLSIPVLIFSLCFVFLHYGKGDLLREIIALLIGLGGGGAGGYTLGRASKRGSDA